MKGPKNRGKHRFSHSLEPCHAVYFDSMSTTTVKGSIEPRVLVSAPHERHMGIQREETRYSDKRVRRMMKGT